MGRDLPRTQPASPPAEGLEVEVTRIGAMTINQLRATWRKVFASDPPPAFSKDLLAYTYADLREQFDTPKDCNAHCTIGCARTASATDQWRLQRGLTEAPLAAPA